MYDELVKRLREDVPTALAKCDFDFVEDWSKEAAYAIEELSADCDMYRKAMTDEHNRAARLLWEKEHSWISVEERLPDQNSGNLYICLIVGGEYGQLSWYELCDFAEGQFWIQDQLYEGHVTHWMPLPEPPEEE